MESSTDDGLPVYDTRIPVTEPPPKYSAVVVDDFIVQNNNAPYIAPINISGTDNDVNCDCNICLESFRSCLKGCVGQIWNHIKTCFVSNANATGKVLGLLIVGAIMIAINFGFSICMIVFGFIYKGKTTCDTFLDPSVFLIVAGFCLISFGISLYKDDKSFNGLVFTFLFIWGIVGAVIIWRDCPYVDPYAIRVLMWLYVMCTVGVVCFVILIGILATIIA